MKPRQAEILDNPKKKELTALKLISKAALSISDGDLIDSMIRGSQQHWSLMPHHAIASVVRPVSFAYGVNSQGFPNFPGWLGKNSTATRISRSAVELQARMRLVTSGSRFAIRETYVPYLFKSLSDPLIKNGAVSMTSNLRRCFDRMYAYRNLMTTTTELLFLSFFSTGWNPTSRRRNGRLLSGN